MPSVINQSPDEGWDRVATRLQAEMKRRGISNNQIAREIGMAPATIQAVLAGQPIRRADRAAALAGVFGWAGDAFDRIRAGQEPEASPSDDVTVRGVELATRTDLDAVASEVAELRDALSDRVLRGWAGGEPAAAEDVDAFMERFSDQLSRYRLDEVLDRLRNLEARVARLEVTGDLGDDASVHEWPVAAEEGGDAHEAPSPTDVRPRPRPGAVRSEIDPEGPEHGA